MRDSLFLLGTESMADQFRFMSLMCFYLTLFSLSVFILQHKNYDSSCGVIINLDQPAQEDSVLVKVLKRQGAIPFVKTNLPQALLK